MWVKMPDVGVRAEMSKTNFQNTVWVIIPIQTQSKKDLVLCNYSTEVATYIFCWTFPTLLLLSKKEWP